MQKHPSSQEALAEIFRKLSEIWTFCQGVSIFPLGGNFDLKICWWKGFNFLHVWSEEPLILFRSSKSSSDASLPTASALPVSSPVRASLPCWSDSSVQKCSICHPKPWKGVGKGITKKGRRVQQKPQRKDKNWRKGGIENKRYFMLKKSLPKNEMYPKILPPVHWK